MTPRAYYGTLLKKCRLPASCENAGAELSWELFWDAPLFEEDLSIIPRGEESNCPKALETSKSSRSQRQA